MCKWFTAGGWNHDISEFCKTREDWQQNKGTHIHLIIGASNLTCEWALNIVFTGKNLSTSQLLVRWFLWILPWCESLQLCFCLLAGWTSRHFQVVKHESRLAWNSELNFQNHGGFQFVCFSTSDNDYSSFWVIVWTWRLSPQQWDRNQLTESVAKLLLNETPEKSKVSPNRCKIFRFGSVFWGCIIYRWL